MGEEKGYYRPIPDPHACVAVFSHRDEHVYPHIHMGKAKRSETDEIFAHRRCLVNAR